MRKNIGIVLFFIIFLGIFTSCGQNAEEAVRDMKDSKKDVTFEELGLNGNKDNKNEGEEYKIEKRSYENTGVIIDTVVDVFRERDVKSERVTQAIFNQPVTILEQQGVWTKVQVVDGYTGWIKTKYMDRDCTSIIAEDYKFRVVITGKSKRIYSQLQGGITIKEVVMGTELYSNKKVDGAYRVTLPGRVTGWISETGTIQVPVDEHIPKTSAEDFVATVLRLKGTSYLWGGISSWGIDCSGLTYITTRINGVDLPRDAHEQYEVGSRISKKLIRRGDLVFFSNKPGSENITHVGISLGDGSFIHASKAKGYVTISSLDEPYFKERLVGVKRLF